MILVGGLTGVVPITVASLMSGDESRIHVDKVIHFTGYATLSFVLALRPILYVPGLIAMIALGFGIEYMRAFTVFAMEADDLIGGSQETDRLSRSSALSASISARPWRILEERERSS